MVVALLASLATPAGALPIEAVGEPTNFGLECACNWVRVSARTDGQLDLFVTGGGNYRHAIIQKLPDGWRVQGSPSALADNGELVDHAITKCSDGTWLHVASANRTERLDDSIYVYHYTEDFEVLAESLAVDGDDVRRFNDAPLLCDPRHVGTVGHPRDLASHDGRFYFLTESGEVSGETYLDTVPPVGGSTLAWDADRGQYLSFRALGPDSSLFVVPLNTELQQDGDWVLLDVGDFPYVSWPQAALKLDEYWFVAHLVRLDKPYASDAGEIAVTVIDGELQHVQTVVITDVSPGQGAHRPGITVLGDKLIVSYEVDLSPRLVELSLDPALVGTLVTETGTPAWAAPGGGSGSGTGTPTDTGEPDPIDTGGSGSGSGSGGDPEPQAVPPVAEAGADRQTQVQVPIELDASSSSHPEGAALTYAWSSPSPDVFLSDADTAAPRFVAGSPGTYIVQLTVSADGQVATDSLSVTVADADGCGCSQGPARSSGVLVVLAGLLPLAIRRRTGRRR